MKKLLSILSSTLQGGVRGGLLFLLFFASASAIYASDTQVDGIWYDFDNSTKTAYVTYRGSAYGNYEGEYSGSVIIPETVTYNGTTYSVTSIGNHAFDGCSSLTSVTIPNGVTSIGNYAFDCCYKLTSVTIPNSMTSIGEGAFFDCYSLTSVTIPNSVTSIGDWAFAGCSSLNSVTIPNSVTSIGKSAFNDCSSLTSVTIGESVTSIGEGAFYECFSLNSVTIPNSVTSIGKSAFYYCSSLTSVTIGESVTSIGERAFEGCSSLPVKNNLRYADTYLVEAVNKTLSIYSIKEGTKWVGDHAFENCSSLTSVTIPSSVTEIGSYAFRECEKLGTVILGEKIKEIGNYAFEECNKLYHIYCYAPEPPVIEDNVFTNYNVNLYVPCNYLDNYKYDRVFGSFRYIQCIESEDVTTNDVVITPSTNDVTITWPTEGNADTYTIVIKKGNEVFCTLTFNAEGQLLNIAFAPSRDGNNHPVQYAEQAGNGYRFTVTGLEEGTHYAYNIDVRDTANKTIKSYTGEFTTESTTAVENTHSQSPITDCQKILYEDHIYILRDGKTYTIMGAEVK